jgi:hypothetical protein
VVFKALVGALYEDKKSAGGMDTVQCLVNRFVWRTQIFHEHQPSPPIPAATEVKTKVEPANDDDLLISPLRRRLPPAIEPAQSVQRAIRGGGSPIFPRANTSNPPNQSSGARTKRHRPFDIVDVDDDDPNPLVVEARNQLGRLLTAEHINFDSIRAGTETQWDKSPDERYLTTIVLPEVDTVKAAGASREEAEIMAYTQMQSLVQEFLKSKRGFSVEDVIPDSSMVIDHDAPTPPAPEPQEIAVLSSIQVPINIDNE